MTGSVVCPTRERDGFANETERWFDDYLHARSLPHRYEEEAAGRRPDFWVDHPLGTVVCEVCELAPDISWNSFGCGPPVPPKLREAIHRKGKQARGVKGRHPFVLVLGSGRTPAREDERAIRRALEDHPTRTPFLRPQILVPFVIASAMFGDPVVRIPVNTRTGVADADRGHLGFHRNGRMRPARGDQPGQGSRFSALAVVRRFNPTEQTLHREIERRRSRMGSSGSKRNARIIVGTLNEMQGKGLFDPQARVVRLDVCHNLYALLPLNLKVLDGPHDRQYGVSAAGGWELFKAGARNDEVPDAS